MMLRPPLKWAGGKRWLVPHLTGIWARHRHRRLVEPFCGGLSVTLGLRPEQGHQNDANPHVINFYQWLQRGLRVSLTPENSARRFYERRRRFNALIGEGRERTSEAAELFYYLNRTCYNGLCRFNRSGFFNVPFGRYARIRLDADLAQYQQPLSAYTFTAGDFELVPLHADDFVYADPPYDVEFTSYARGGFSWGDQVRVAEWLSRHRGPVLLSNQATRRVVELYERLGYDLRYLQGPRMISCDGNRAKAREVLASRNL